jgi:twinkle protein
MTMDARNWLTQIRKLDPALLEDAGVRFKGDAMAFPYVANGEHYADKFRTVEKKFWSTAGVSRRLYNFDALKRNEDQPIILTEGEIDCLSIRQAGFERVVSLPDGWTKDGNKIDCILEAVDWLRKAPCVIVAGDMDETGESLPRAVANALEGMDVRAVVWGEGCKDANDVLCDLGEREIVARVNAAKRVDPPGGSITGFLDLPPLSRRRVLRIGKKPFDFRIALELGAISVGTGTPGSGKSTFVTWAADEISRAERIRVGMMAFETHPHRLRDHLARINTGKTWDELPVDAQKRLAAELDERWRIVHRKYDETQHNLGWLKNMVHTLAVRDGCKLIVIDPWNELEHLPEPGENMTSYINFALQQIRVWAEKLEVHICLIAHPRKMMTDGKPRAATGYDVADSAAFANKPSLGFTVFPTKDESGFEVVEIHTWKVRDTQLYDASKGISQVQFYPELMTYRRIGE